MSQEKERPSFSDALSLCPLFKSMNGRTKSILYSLEETEFSSGEELTGGEQSPSLGIVTRGRVRIMGRGSGKRVLLNRVEKGGVFGAATVFCEKKESVSTVYADTPCRVLLVPLETLSDILEGDHGVALEYIKMLSEKIYFLNNRIQSFTAKNADAALAAFLLERLESGKPLVFPMTRLASALDIGRTTLYRALDSLTACNAISCDGKVITVLNKEILEKKVEL